MKILVLTLLCLFMAAPAYSQLVVDVTPTWWEVQIHTVPSVVKITVPPPVNNGDYVAVVPPTQAQTVYNNWQYARNAKAGILEFENMRPGTYEARFFSLPSGGTAPGKLMDTKAVMVPVPAPRPIEVVSGATVVITRRATDGARDISIRIKDDQSEVQVTADKSDDIKVSKPGP